VGDRDVVVSTEISQASQQPVRADWRVRRYGNALKIIDIKVEGISMLTSQREEFTAVIQRNGFDGLLNLLRQQTEASASPGLSSSVASAS
jgi:phospholipid transport system substrate-binding protein